MITCIPQNISSLVVYYNQDLFDAAGVAYPTADWSWDDFVKTAVALTQDTNGDGIIDQYGAGIVPSLYRLAPFVWQNGGPIVNSEESPTRLTITRPPAQEALQWFVDLRQVHGVVPGREEEAAQDSESRFVAGTTAMFFDSRRATPTFREIEGFVWDVAPLPNGKETGPPSAPIRRIPYQSIDHRFVRGLSTTPMHSLPLARSRKRSTYWRRPVLSSA